jgi:hypothetical protein
MDSQDHYAILGLDESATDEEIRMASRRLWKFWHTDRNKSPEAADRFAEVTEAHRVLLNPDLRRAFDRSRRDTDTGTADSTHAADEPSVPLPDDDEIDFGDLTAGDAPVERVIRVRAAGSWPVLISRRPSSGDLWTSVLEPPEDDDEVVMELHIIAAAPLGTRPGRSTDRIEILFDGTPAAITFVFRVIGTGHSTKSAPSDPTIWTPPFSSPAIPSIFRLRWVQVSLIILAIITIGLIAHSGSHQSPSITAPPSSSPPVVASGSSGSTTTSPSLTQPQPSSPTPDVPTPTTANAGASVALPVSAWAPFGGAIMSTVDAAGTFSTSFDSTYWGGVSAAPSVGCNYRFDGMADLVSEGGPGYGFFVRGSIDSTGTPHGVGIQYDPGAGGYHDTLLPDGSESGTVTSTPLDNNWHAIVVEVVGNQYESFVDGKMIFHGTTSLTCGGVFIRVWNGAVVQLSRLSVTPINSLSG